MDTQTDRHALHPRTHSERKLPLRYRCRGGECGAARSRPERDTRLRATTPPRRRPPPRLLTRPCRSARVPPPPSA
eukprot:6200358-Prymnesium_polylepis.1